MSDEQNVKGDASQEASPHRQPTNGEDHVDIVESSLEAVEQAQIRGRKLPDPPIRYTAHYLALILVYSMAGTIFLTFVLAFVEEIRYPEAPKIFVDNVASLFEHLGKLLSTVFGPLMAFVLGYYFSKGKAR